MGRSATNAELRIALAPESAYEAILALHHEAGWNPSRVDGEVWGAWEHGELVGSIQFEDVGSPMFSSSERWSFAKMRGVTGSARRCSPR